MTPTATMPCLKAPVLLVHGLLGFKRVQLAGRTVVDYFPGITEAIEAAGNRVFLPGLAPTGGIAERARELKRFILEVSPQEPVHIIAHSLGGLDARFLISCLDMDRHVLSLTTLGTPHKGSAFADWGLRRLHRMLGPMFTFFDMPTQAFRDLTRESCQAFNEAVPDRAHVRYFSVAGRHDGNFLNPEWLVPYHVVLRQEGPNDGVVSVASARYGEVTDIWEGDHLSLVNWGHALMPRRLLRDPAPRYATLLQRLADLGY